MSDQQATSACPHPEAVGTRWGDPISEERQAELQGYLDLWESEIGYSARRGPFDSDGWKGTGTAGPHLTGADVFWLAEQSEHDRFGGVPYLHLEGAILGWTHLEGTDLRGAHLERAYLFGAHLKSADLRGAFFDSKTSLNAAVLNHKTRLGDI